MREDNGRQWEPQEGGRTIQHRHTCGETMRGNGRQRETMGDKGRQDLGRWTQHPTQANM